MGLGGQLTADLAETWTEEQERTEQTELKRFEKLLFCCSGGTTANGRRWTTKWDERLARVSVKDERSVRRGTLKEVDGAQASSGFLPVCDLPLKASELADELRRLSNCRRRGLGVRRKAKSR